MKSAQQMHFRLHFFFFNDTATTEIYTLSLHDALPISRRRIPALVRGPRRCGLRDVPRPVHQAAQEEADGISPAALLRLARLHSRSAAPPGGGNWVEPDRHGHRLSVPVDEDLGGPHPRHARA